MKDKTVLVLDLPHSLTLRNALSAYSDMLDKLIEVETNEVALSIWKHEKDRCQRLLETQMENLQKIL